MAFIDQQLSHTPPWLTKLRAIVRSREVPNLIPMLFQYRFKIILYSHQWQGSISLSQPSLHSVSKPGRYTVSQYSCTHIPNRNVQHQIGACDCQQSYIPHQSIETSQRNPGIKRHTTSPYFICQPAWALVRTSPYRKRTGAYIIQTITFLCKPCHATDNDASPSPRKQFRCVANQLHSYQRH